jgi:hypothetical protein
MQAHERAFEWAWRWLPGYVGMGAVGLALAWSKNSRTKERATASMHARRLGRRSCAVAALERSMTCAGA